MGSVGNMSEEKVIFGAQAGDNRHGNLNESALVGGRDEIEGWESET